MSNEIKLYLIRHARQESPLCNVNVPLAKEGLIQSELAAQRLKTYNLDAVYSSDLIRAEMTADIIRRTAVCRKTEAEEIKETEEIKEITEFTELREIDFGYLTGLSDKVLKEKFADYFDERDRFKEDIAIPGGENGTQVYERVKKAIDIIIENSQKYGHENVAVVTHGGAIRCFLAGILDIPQAKRFLIAKTLENTSITQVNYDCLNGSFYVERINDYSHLEGHEHLLRAAFKRE